MINQKDISFVSYGCARAVEKGLARCGLKLSNTITTTNVWLFGAYLYIIENQKLIIDFIKGADTKLVIHWTGSDLETIYLLSYTFRKLLFTSPNVTHVVEWYHTRKELARLSGLAEKNIYIVPILSEQFYEPISGDACAVYCPNEKYIDSIDQAIKIGIKKLVIYGVVTDKFKTYLETTYPDTEKEILGWVDINDIMKKCNAVSRYLSHDGLPVSFMEFGASGRTIYTNDIYGVLPKTTEEWQYYNTPERFIRNVFSLFNKIDTVTYWQKRGEGYEKQYNKLYDKICRGLDSVIGETKTVLDIGCGDGRYKQYFSDKGISYYGFDVSKSIKPKDKNMVMNICDMRDFNAGNNSFDLGIAITSFQNLLPCEIKEQVEKYLLICKKIVIVEDFNRNKEAAYCWKHDYDSILRVLDVAYKYTQIPDTEYKTLEIYKC